MAERIFLGNTGFLPELIAERLLRDSGTGNAPDLSNILLTLPGKLARKNVCKYLMAKAPHGVLMPQILTPGLLFRYGMSDIQELPVIADELLWTQAVRQAMQTPEKFDLIFPGKLEAPEYLLSGRKFQAFRNETVRGGLSLADMAPLTGERGRQLAALEKIYLRELSAAGFRDPLELDKLAAADCSAFVPGSKIVIAGIPDLPNMLRKKLEHIDRNFPGMIEIWIHAPECDCHEYDQWGCPIPEVWQNKALLLPPDGLDLLLNPEQAAYFAAQKVAKQSAFVPDNYTVVLGDPAMADSFRGEFGKFYYEDEQNKLEVYDPSGVPMSKLRLWRVGNLLCRMLRNNGDFFSAVELLRSHDYLLHWEHPVKIMVILDEFAADFAPDDLAQAIELAEYRKVRNPDYELLLPVLRELAAWQKRLDILSVPEFLREFYRTLYPESLDIDREMIFQVPFSSECAVLRELLDNFAGLPEKLLENCGKHQLLEMFFNHCANITVAAVPGKFSYGLEGCLEIPFLDTPHVIFCGMNEKYYPDKIEITPFLNDSLRRRAGLRSNRETAARARCHLQSLLACRPHGNVNLLVLRRDGAGDILRPSSLLWAGSDLPEEELLKRCAMLFRDPEKLPEQPESSSGNKIFRLRPQLDYLRDKTSGMLRISPTEIDDYLTSPYLFYMRRVRHVDAGEYLREEPGANFTGNFIHRAIELLGTAHYSGVQALADALERNMEQAVNEDFGSASHPVLLKIQIESMRQRLKTAAVLLYKEQIDGFSPLAVEYKFENIAFAGALFTGKIDRIEYNVATRTLRIVDIKTGKKVPVRDAHCKKGGKGVRFLKLQLPLYALLLPEDEKFRQKFPGLVIDKIECAYLSLPVNVTDSAMDIWEQDDFNKILPDAAEKTRQIVTEIMEMPGQVLCEDPDEFRKSKNSLQFMFPAGLREGLTNVTWRPPESAPVEITGDDEKDPAKKRKTKSAVPEAVITDVSAGLPQPPGAAPAQFACRCCDCPPEKRAGCGCFKGDRSGCRSFNGFKCFNIITASAGTGKTTRLAMRFIQLLSYGADPAQIMAVTFTRDAAAEIFDKIIELLLDFARNGDLKCRNIDRAGVIDILRKLLNCEKELQIGTIDSFFMKLVTVFAPELGIWGEININDQKDLRLIRRTVREWIRSLADAGELDELRELLKDTNPSDSMGFSGGLQKILQDVYPFYMSKIRQLPDGSMPQLEQLPWQPDVRDVMEIGELEFTAAAIREFAVELESESDFCTNKSKAGSMRGWAGKLKKMAEFLLITPLEYGKVDDVVQDFYKNILARNGVNWSCGDGELYYTSELRFSLKCSKSIRRAFRHIRALEFLRARKKTRAVFGMMQLFDRIYDTKVRSTGNLTFSDLPYLLCHRDPETREAILGNADRVMEARLDNEISHYMFDEFQDTSDIQYLAFDGMIRELAAGESERFRSFFCVGDIKQSIYQWRDGNPGLFAYLQHLLAPAAAQKGYEPGDSLTLSYRTSWYVLETVNRIFAPGYDGDSPFFADAVEKMKFETHRAGKDMEGFAALIECPKESSRDTVNAVGKAKTIFEIIRRINPLKKALSVGILVQKNDTVETFAEELRDLARRAQWDLPVSADGKVTISDSMAFNLFRFMLIMAEHPQDKLAREFIETVTFETRESTPGEPDAAWILKKMRFQEDADLRDALREELFRSGIAGIARRFLDGFGPEMNAFDRKRMEIVERAARTFSGTAAEFIENIDILSTKEGALDKTVQIMTFHRSKGLEFDIVFLPDTANSPGNSGSRLLPEVMELGMNMESSDGTLPEPEWISYLPVTGFTGEVPEFAANKEMKDAAQAFERCCALYVALTRVKRALYILISPGGGSESMALDRVMRERLSVFGIQNVDCGWFSELQEVSGLKNKLSLHYTFGRESWHGLIATAKDDGKTSVATAISWKVTTKPADQTIAHASDEKAAVIIPAKRFAAAGGTAVGTMVHELMEKIIWIDPAEWNAGEFCQKNLPDSPFAAAAEHIFCRAMAPDSEIYAVLCAPEAGGEVEVWNERRFLVTLPNGKNYSGAFDRVVVYYQNAVPVKAEIFDWKSDDLAAPEAFLSYSGQLQIYREVLAHMLALPESAVTASICALKLQKVIKVW